MNKININGTFQNSKGRWLATSQRIPAHHNAVKVVNGQKEYHFCFDSCVAPDGEETYLLLKRPLSHNGRRHKAASSYAMTYHTESSPHGKT